MLLNILKYGVSEGLAKLAPFLTTLYVAKFLSPELFGKYSLIVVLVEVVFIFVSFNSQATTRIDYFKESRVDFCLIKQNQIAISLLVAGAGILSLFFLSKEEQLITLILFLSALFRTGAVFILAIFQCSKQVNVYIYSNMTFVGVLSISIYAFLQVGSSYFSWLFAMLIASTVQFLLVLKLYGLKSFRAYWPKSITFNSLKGAFIPAVLFMPQAIGWWLKNGADRILINEFLGAEILGNYSLAFQFSSILILVVTTVNLALVPVINENLSNKKIDYVLKTLFSMALFCMVFTFALYFINVAALDYAYKNIYPMAKNMMFYLCISNLFQALNMIYINVLYFENEGRYVAKVVLLGFSLQVVFNFSLLYFFDKSVIEMILSSMFFNFIILFNLIRLMVVRKHYLMTLIVIEIIFITLINLFYYYLNFYFIA